jgi:hypothetical protein
VCRVAAMPAIMSGASDWPIRVDPTAHTASFAASKRTALLMPCLKLRPATHHTRTARMRPRASVRPLPRGAAPAAHLEREQQADGLQALLAAVHIVPQEQVVGLRREAAVLK